MLFNSYAFIYCDDTHWSYKASEAISQYLFHESLNI